MRWYIISIKRYLLICILLATISILIFSVIIFKWTNTKNCQVFNSIEHTTVRVTDRLTTIFDRELISARIYNNSELRSKLMRKRVERISRKIKKTKLIALNNRPTESPNYNIHAFYYAWYANLEYDNEYRHWNHQYLPNWKHEDHKIYPTGSHEPPSDIGSNFYPKLGCYSSSDPVVIETHFKWLYDAGIGVVVLSWTVPNVKDSPEKTLSLLFNKAKKYKLKIALHIEPYMNRNPINFLKYLKKFVDKYLDHPALYKMKKPSTDIDVPVFYIYDSYLTPASAWKEMLNVQGNLSVRNTKYDGIYLGLLVDMQHRYHIKKSYFDGFYTYFACNGFTYGSTWKNWRSLVKFAKQNGLMFVPSVGPGYVDTRIRPWNTANTRHRRHGQYYEVAWRSAINNRANFVSITSFNEWHEGTQIEPAVEKSIDGYVYLNYEPEGHDFYLNLTKSWVEKFNKSFV